VRVLESRQPPCEGSARPSRAHELHRGDRDTQAFKWPVALAGFGLMVLAVYISIQVMLHALRAT
jgi:hypothetical protein